jgi:hypothetical protein
MTVDSRATTPIDDFKARDTIGERDTCITVANDYESAAEESYLKKDRRSLMLSAATA